MSVVQFAAIYCLILCEHNTLTPSVGTFVQIAEQREKLSILVYKLAEPNTRFSFHVQLFL